MTALFPKLLLLALAAAVLGGCTTAASRSRHGSSLPPALAGIPDLVCWWDFQEPAGAARQSRSGHAYELQECNGPIERVTDGLFGPFAARLNKGQWLVAPRTNCPALDLHGPEAQVTVVAWLKWESDRRGGCEAVAGVWNETKRQRQYCLFLNLGIHDSRQQVGGHVSAIGGPTPGYRYCMDAAIGATAVPRSGWQCVGFTYDGEFARAYLNGKLDVRPGLNPYPYPGGLFDGGPEGADFTVGGVSRSGEMGNWFAGTLGGLAVFQRALSEAEMRQLSSPVRRKSLPR
jgi:hypothetical protein